MISRVLSPSPALHTLLANIPNTGANQATGRFSENDAQNQNAFDFFCFGASNLLRLDNLTYDRDLLPRKFSTSLFVG